MENFRKFVTGWFGKGLLVLFTIPFAFLGIESYFAQSGSPNATHVINGDSIAKEDLDAQIQSLQRNFLQSVGGDASLLNQEFIYKAALDNLISRQLLVQQTNKLNLALSAAQIEQMLTQNEQLQENGVFSAQKYEQYLRDTKQTNDSFVAQVRQDQALQMLVAGLSMALVNAKDIEQINTLASEQRHLHLASVPLKPYLQDLSVRDAEIQSYYDKHQKQFIQLAQADVSFVVVKPEQLLKQNVTVSDEDLKQAYQQYVQNLPRKVKHILVTTSGRNDTEAQQRAQEAYNKIKAGESFANIAKAYSEDIDSKENGGLIANYAKGSVSEQFDQAIQMTAVGEVSQPVKTNFGYHLVSSELNNAPSFESVKATLTAQVQKHKTETAIVETINQLNEDVMGSDSLETIQQAVQGATVQTTHLVANTQHPILSQPLVKNRIFGDESKQGEYRASSGLQLSNGDVVWVKVSNYTPAGVQTFDKVKEYAKTLALNEKAAELAKQKLQTTLADFKTKLANEVLASSDLKFEDAGFLRRGQNLLPQVQNVAFSLPTPEKSKWSVGTLNMGNELILIAVSEVKHSTADKAEQIGKNELKNYYAQRELGDYLYYLRSNAQIKDVQKK